MSFQAFEQTIISPALRRVAGHWNEVRGERRMPAWRDIRPSALAAELPIVWSWKYDVGADRFTGRLAGDVIETIFGKSFRGADMADMFYPVSLENVFARHKRVATEPALHRSYGAVFWHLHRFGIGERIILPLSDSGAGGDGVLGATAYDPFSVSPTSHADEEWSSLG